MTSSASSSEILRITNRLIADNVCQATLYGDSKWHILAIVLSNSDIILWEVTTENTKPVMKWIPWNTDLNSKIQAIAFQQPTPESLSEHKIHLLILTYDSTIHLISVDDIINGGNSTQKNVKYSVISSGPFVPFQPTALVWWNSSHRIHKNIAIIGDNSGQLVFYSLTRACFVASLNTGKKSSILSLSICSDFFQDCSYLIITNDSRNQWKLQLEKEVNGARVILIHFEENETRAEKNGDIIKSHKSRLQEFKQISVETFSLLKQKLHDTKKVTSEKTKPGNSVTEMAELQAFDCYGDAFLSVQRYRNRQVLGALYIPESLLMLFLQNKESSHMIQYKLEISSSVTTILLTSSFVYVADVMETRHRILVFSTRMSEYKKNDSDYNPASFIQSFVFPENEKILCLFLAKVKLPINEKILNAASFMNTEQSSSSQNRSRSKQIQTEEDWNEACLAVTNKGVYVINLRNNPFNLALDCLKTDFNLIKKLPFIFNLPLSKVIEYVSEQLIEEKKVEDAVLICNTFKYYSEKMTLKLASFGFINELLEHTEYLLNQNDLDLPLVERIHLSNFVISCYAEKFLRDPSNIVLEQRFRKFLKENRYFDEEVNVYILGNYRLCSFLHFLCIWRGLYIDATVALTNMISQNQADKFKILHKFDGFWELFSENLLVDAFVLSPRTVHLHIHFLREHLNELPPHILKKLYHFYDPTQPVLKPAMYRMLHASREEYLEAFDFENDKWGCDANMFDWITHFLFLHVHLFKERSYDKSLTKYAIHSLYRSVTRSSESSTKQNESHNSISPPVISAGFAHAALVRDGSLVTWGQSTHGCLGAGPTLSQNCSPVLNSWFDDHRIRVKNVSCGRHHTLALTENGVYAWGSCKFGQLGVGHAGQSVHPRLVEMLSSRVIVSVAAGQYHSLAVDIDGKLWTWGWGVYGQLGHGNTDDQYYPKCVQKLERKFVTSASGGQAHSLILTDKGKVFTFGCNAYGQLGIGTNIKSSVPVKVFGIQENIVMITTNYFHNLALSDFNRLYTWGCSPQVLKLQAQSQKRSKSLANAEKHHHELIVQAEQCNNVDLIAPSTSNATELSNVAFEHLPVPIDNGKHLSPTLIDTMFVEGNIMQISCGLFHSALLTTEGQIYTWGRNTDGQLGNCKRQTEIQIPTVVDIFPTKLMPSNKQHVEIFSRPLWRVSCGKDYTLVVELEGRIFGWGNNSSAQLGTSPQEDFSIKRFLNGKFIVNNYAKRVIKLSQSNINVIEKPVEIISIPKLPYLFVHDGNCPDRYLRMECDVDLPGVNYPRYPIESSESVSSLNASKNQILHYYLECFHRYYNAEFILQTCAYLSNFQSVAKICCLNRRFYDAFFYELKALLSHVQENYYISSFKDGYGLSKNSLVAKNIESCADTRQSCNDERVKNTTFEFMEDVIVESMSILEHYSEMTLKFTPRKIGSFLRKSISTWIVWDLPMRPLEEFFSLHMDTVAYHLAVFLFCDGHHQVPNPLDEPDVSNSSHMNNGLTERKLCSSPYSSQKPNPLSSKTIKYPFMNNSETKASYRSLYLRKNGKNLESTDVKYRLEPGEILNNLSVQFVLELCAVVVDLVSSKSPSEYEEFIRLMHEIIFAPSVLKSDDRNADEILSSVLNTLQRNQSAPKKFIQISYKELQDRTIEDKFIVFSCRHFFTSQADFEKEVRNVIRELDGLRLLNTSELVNRLYSTSNFDTCCPNCLFRCIEGEINVSNTTKT